MTEQSKVGVLANKCSPYVLRVMDRHIAANCARGDADLIASRAAVNDALTTLRMVERAWSSGVPGYVDPGSPLAQVQSAIAGLVGGAP